MSEPSRFRICGLLAPLLIAGSFASADEEVVANLALAAAAERTLRNSPELQAFSAEVRAADARAVQARLQLNPEIDVRVEDVLGRDDFSGGRQAQITVEIARAIELGGKRKARTDASERGIDVALRDYEVARSDALATMAKRFFRVLAAQELVELADRHVAILDRALQAVRRRITAGAASPVEETRATIALARGRLLKEDLRHELEVARFALASTWGERSPSFDRVVGSLARRDDVPRWEELEAEIDASPEVAKRTSEAALRGAEVEVARSRGYPNLAVTGGLRRLEAFDDEAFVFGIRIPFPIFDRNQGGIREAEAAAEKASADRSATEIRLRAALFGLHQELLHAGHTLDMLENEILPNAERSLETISRGYEQGTFSSLDLLDASRTATEVRRERVEIAESLQTLRVEIARLTGTPPPGAPEENAR